MNKLEISANFSRYAHLYDDYAQVQKKSALALFTELKRGKFDKILELGCGTGNFTLLLCRHFNSAEIKAVDISKEMLAVAQEKLKGNKVEFIASDAEELALEGKFDLITSNACFQWFEDLESTFSKYRSMLDMKGEICFSIFGPQTFRELNTALHAYFSGSGISVDGFASKDNVIELLNANFSSVKVKEIIFKEEFSCLLDLLRKIKYTGTRGRGLGEKVSFNRQDIHELEQLYLAKFKKITATFQVFLCQAKAG